MLLNFAKISGIEVVLMLMKILGFIELGFGVIIGFHLLYGMFAIDTVITALYYFFIRGTIFVVVSKDFASIVDLVFGIYAVLALNSIFSHYSITVALIVWHSQKAVFSLLGN